VCKQQIDECGEGGATKGKSQQEKDLEQQDLARRRPLHTCASTSAACSLAMAAGRPSGLCTMSFPSRES
jgi:hypothetical protein